MTSMTLKAVKAKYGDAMILTAGGATVLIDGGPPGVYNRYLRKHLEMLDDGGYEPPEIDLMMVSHVDSDHIAGIMDLTQDMREAEDEDAKPPARIHRAWLNSFSDTLVKSGLETTSGAGASPASMAGAAEDDAIVAEKLDGHTKLVLSSVNQGRTLRTNLKALSIPINAMFENKMAIAGAAAPWKKGGAENHRHRPHPERG